MPAILAAFVALCLGACGGAPSTERPSIVLFVIDTLRADAVSAYGHVRSTTPHLDRLAAEGLRFSRAYASAPWTLPSHATLFTGTRVDQHGVGVRGGSALPAGLPTLAERLREAGYETVGFSENPLVSADFAMERGFDSLRSMSAAQFAKESSTPGASDFSVEALVGEWAAKRSAARPFFLFVNVMDAHEPYVVRERNYFLAPAAAARAGTVPQAPPLVCTHGLGDGDLEVLRGLYLGDVAAADRKLGAVRDRLAAAGYSRSVVTIVTSDHGQHLGEHGLLNHQFSIRDELLRVPLIVHGTDATAPAVIDDLVGLVDVMPSALAWAGVQPPAGLAGTPLPTAARGERSARSIVAEFGDWIAAMPRDLPKWSADGARQTASARDRSCTSEDLVFGDMAAVIRDRYKLVWFARYPAELYDLGADPREQSDLAATAAEPFAALRKELAEVAHAANTAAPASSGTGALDRRLAEALESLGYLD
jgi:arylsulfatase A-like enzyme